MIGKIVARCCCESEGVVLGDPEEGYGDDGPSDSTADCPRVVRWRVPKSQIKWGLDCCNLGGRSGPGGGSRK